MPRSGHNGLMNWLVAQRGYTTDIFLKHPPGLGTTNLGRSGSSLFIGASDVLNPRKKSIIAEHLAMEDGLIIIADDEANDKLETTTYILTHLEKRYGRIELIMIFRDWYNNLASLLKSNIGYRPMHKQKWLGQAKEILGITHTLPHFYPILYNKWFTSIEYRQQICSDLGYTFTDNYLNTMPYVASSFDGMKMDGKAQQMDVLRRYKEFLGDTIYQQECRDEEIYTLNRQIFGENKDDTLDWRKRLYWAASQASFSGFWQGLFSTQ